MTAETFRLAGFLFLAFALQYFWLRRIEEILNGIFAARKSPDGFTFEHAKVIFAVIVVHGLVFLLSLFLLIAAFPNGDASGDISGFKLCFCVFAGLSILGLLVAVTRALLNAVRKRQLGGTGFALWSIGLCLSAFPAHFCFAMIFDLFQFQG